jgi:hypothetical protein
MIVSFLAFAFLARPGRDVPLYLICYYCFFDSHAHGIGNAYARAALQMSGKAIISSPSRLIFMLVAESES